MTNEEKLTKLQSVLQMMFYSEGRHNLSIAEHIKDGKCMASVVWGGMKSDQMNIVAESDAEYEEKLIKTLKLFIGGEIKAMREKANKINSAADEYENNVKSLDA